MRRSIGTALLLGAALAGHTVLAKSEPPSQALASDRSAAVLLIGEIPLLELEAVVKQPVKVSIQADCPSPQARCQAESKTLENRRLIGCEELIRTVEFVARSNRNRHLPLHLKLEDSKNLSGKGQSFRIFYEQFRGPKALATINALEKCEKEAKLRGVQLSPILPEHKSFLYRQIDPVEDRSPSHTDLL